MPTDNELLRMIYLKIGQGGGLPTSVVSGTVGLDEPTLTALEQITIGGEVEVKNDSGSPIPVNVMNSPEVPTNTVNNWRSLVHAIPNIDGATGRRSWNVPANKEWQLLGVAATLQTSATPGNRQVELVINPQLNNVTVQHFRLPVGTTQAANLTYTYRWGLGLPYMTAAQANTVICPLSPDILGASTSIIIWDRSQIHTAGDVWSEVRLLVAERSV